MILHVSELFTQWFVSGSGSDSFAVTIRSGGKELFKFQERLDSSTGPGTAADPTPWIKMYEQPPQWEPGHYIDWVRAFTKVIDVSDLTKDHPATLEVRLQDLSSTIGWTAVDFRLWTNTRMALTQSPRAFRPRDSREPQIAQCGDNTSDCFPNYIAKLTGMEPVWEGCTYNLKPVMEFRLEHPKGITAWLPGNSTNGGDDKDSVPDYVFDQMDGHNPSGTFESPTGGNLSITTKAGAMEATLTVSSQDYGGVANLRGWIRFGDEPKKFEAEIVAEGSEADSTTPAVTPSPPACAGTGQFASLPVDQDCNGIADSWEEPYKSQPGYDASSDSETGLGLVPGDGFTVLDEYRGFHYVTDDWVEGDDVLTDLKSRWTSTDPTQIDIFFWDNYGKFTEALRDILAQKTPTATFRRVSERLANPKAAGQPNNGVKKLNERSPTAGGTYSYALDYVDGKPPIPDALGYAVDYRNFGQGILLDNSRIPDFSGSIDPSVFRAMILAHETGHVLGLCHYFNILGYQPPPVSLSDLDFDHYTLGTKSGVPFLGTVSLTYGRYNTYLSTQGITSGDLFDTNYGDLAGNTLLSSDYDTPPVTSPWGGAPQDWAFFGAPLGGWVLPSTVVQNDWYPITPASGQIRVFRQHGYLMDIYPRIHEPPGTNLQRKENWNWRPPEPGYVGDMSLMCGPNCHTTAQKIYDCQ